MPFNFHLQSVLDYRRTLVDRRRAEVAAAERHLRLEEDLLAGLHAAHAYAMAAYQTDVDCTVDVAQSDQLGLHLRELETSIAMQAGALDRARATYECARAELLELEKDAKSLEKLRDRQLEQYETEARRRERAEATEVTATFHRRFQESR